MTGTFELRDDSTWGGETRGSTPYCIKRWSTVRPGVEFVCILWNQTQGRLPFAWSYIDLPQVDPKRDPLRTLLNYYIRTPKMTTSYKP